MDQLLTGILFLAWSIAIDFVFNHRAKVVPEADPDILDFSMSQRTRPRRGDVYRRNNEFRSSAFPFLETKTPTDSLENPLDSPDLSDVEKRVLIEKRRWLATEYPAKLAGLVARIIEDRVESPITAAVLLGLSGAFLGTDTSVGSLSEKDRDCQQFVAFSQILAQLGAAHPGLLNGLVAQDPGMTPEWKALLENHGFIIAEHPDALDRLGPNTVLFSPFVEKSNLGPMLKDRPVSELPMFVGDGCFMKDGAATIIAKINRQLKDNPRAWEENEYSKMFIVIDKIMSVMLDDDVCNHEDLPCPKLIKTFHDKGPWPGLAGLDIWWRPARSEIQKAQDKVIRTFLRACKIGYKGDFVEFARAYRAGLEGLEPALQDRIMYSFLAAAHFERGDRPTLANHVVAYQEGLTKAQLKYEGFIDLWLAQHSSKTWTFSTFISSRPKQ